MYTLIAKNNDNHTQIIAESSNRNELTKLKEELEYIYEDIFNYSIEKIKGK